MPFPPQPQARQMHSPDGPARPAGVPALSGTTRVPQPESASMVSTADSSLQDVTHNRWFSEFAVRLDAGR